MKSKLLAFVGASMILSGSSGCSKVDQASSGDGTGRPAATDAGGNSMNNRTSSAMVEARATIARAYKLRQEGKLEEALKEIDAAIKLNGKDSYAWELRADTNYAGGKVKEAVDDLNRAAELKPDNAALFYRKGTYEGEIKDIEAMRKSADKAVKLDANNKNYLYLRACARAAARDFKGAIDDSDKLLKIDSRFGDAYRLRAFCFNSLGDKKKSDAALRSAARLKDSAPTRFIPVNGMQ